MRLSRNRPSKRTRRSCAHSSPYSDRDDGSGLNGVPRPAIVGEWRSRIDLVASRAMDGHGSDYACR